MLINSINISSFNAKLFKVNIETQELSSSAEWLDSSISPIFFKNKKKFKVIELEIYFKGESRDIILNNISNFMSNLIDEVTLILDGYTNKYKAILRENSTEKTASKKIYKKNLTFIGYEFSNEVIETMNRITNKTINVAGNSETPAIIEITPSIDLIDLTLTGLDDDLIKIKNLKANKKIVVDGENCTITVDGVNKFSDTDMWGFPKLRPGANTITVDKNSTDITIKYKPRYI